MSGAYGTPTQHSNYNAFPKLDSPLIDAEGNINIIWYRFFINLYNMVGSSKVGISTSLVVQQSTTGESILVSPQTGQAVATINTGSTSGEIMSVLPITAPQDQPRPQVIPSVPGDQLHINQFGNTVMDQISFANAVNQSLMLGG